MKNINKLSFSMLALVAALASTDAMAGSYNPTCDGNNAKISYESMGLNPTYNPNLVTNPKYKNFTATMCAMEPFVWGAKVGNTSAPQVMNSDLATFCYRVQAASSSKYMADEYAGKLVTGWQVTGIKADGATSFTKITDGPTLNVTGKGTTENPYLAVDASIANFGQAPSEVGMTYEFTPIWDVYTYELTLNPNVGWGKPVVGTDLTSNSGTTRLFVDGTGIYTDMNRTRMLTVDGANTIVTPSKSGYTFVGYGKTASATACTDTSFDATKCLWIDAAGKVTKDNLGQYVIDDEITELDAVWRAHKFTVRYDIAAGIPSGWQGTATTTNMPPQHECTFDEDCTVTSVVPKSAYLEFAGWKCTGCRAAVATSDTVLTPGYNITNATAGEGTITLTAQWTVRTHPVNFYTTNASTSTVDTLYFVWGGHWFDSIADAATGPTKKLTTAPAAITGATNNGYKQRGWVFSDDAAYTPLVEEDAGALTASTLVVDRDGNLYSASNILGGRISSEQSTTVSVYGAWARPCATNLANVDTCELVIMNDGAVWYKNACDTGYHMGTNNDPVYNENMDKKAD